MHDDPYISNAQVYASSQRSASYSTQDLKDAMALMDKIKARHDVSKSSTYFAILGMSKCCVCGHKAEYREGPPETMVLCACQIAELKKQSEPQSPSLRPDSLYGVGGFVIEPTTTQRAEAGEANK